MANPFRFGKIKGIHDLDPDKEDQQAGLPNMGKLPSDTALKPAALMKLPTEDTPENSTPVSARQARFKRLAGLLGPRK